MAADRYELTNTYKNDKCIVRVYRPILTDEERERRFEEIKRATAKFMLRVEQEKRARG